MTSIQHNNPKDEEILPILSEKEVQHVTPIHSILKTHESSSSKKSVSWSDKTSGVSIAEYKPIPSK